MQTSTIYLLHFERPYRHARHYLGSTSDLDARLADHATGRGANLMRVVTAAGIPWTLARTWPGGRVEERRMKGKATHGSKGHTKRCPLCRGRGRLP